MLSEAERAFVLARRVGHLATADGHAVPHVVPVCFALHGASAYITIDAKPKRTDRPLKRLRNIAANPAASLLVDRYDEDWARLGWVMLHGTAEIIEAETIEAETIEASGEHEAAQALLRARYPQLRAMDIGGLPVIALRIARVASWGDLSPL